MELEDIKITDLEEFYKERDTLSKLAERVTKDEFEKIEEEEEKRKFTEEEVEKMALDTRVICEASDGKVSDFAFELSKDVLRGEVDIEEAIALVRKHFVEK